MLVVLVLVVLAFVVLVLVLLVLVSLMYVLVTTKATSMRRERTARSQIGKQCSHLEER